MAETNALLKRHTGNRIEGSNPSVSASPFLTVSAAGNRLLTGLGGLLRTIPQIDRVVLAPGVTLTRDLAWFPDSGLAGSSDGALLLGSEGCTVGPDGHPLADFVVLETLTARTLPLDAFATLAAQPAFVQAHAAFVAATVRELADGYRVAAACRIEHRLARWLLLAHDRLDADTLAQTHETLAALLHVRRASVTEALHLLEGHGLIRSLRSRVIIRDRAGLEEFASDAYAS